MTLYVQRERLDIEGGWSGNQQEASFMNATLQETSNDPNLEFSIAVHVEIPNYIVEEEHLADYLAAIFAEVTSTHPGLHVEIKLGPAGAGEE